MIIFAFDITAKDKSIQIARHNYNRKCGFLKVYGTLIR